MIRADEIDTDEALRMAWREYQRAPLGRLNATAEALRDAAQACGWQWNRDHLPRWVSRYLKERGAP